MWCFFDEFFFCVSENESFLIYNHVEDLSFFFFYGESRCRIYPRSDEIADPTIRIRVAGCAHIRAYPAGRAIAGEKIEELTLGEMCELVEHNKWILCPLVVIFIILVFKMVHLTTSSRWESPL